MNKKIRVLDCDVVYLSYDEPNAEKNYADLLTKIPWAKRVHGVDGSDSAHKACARLSDTDRVVIVDGDNMIKKEFLNQEIEFVSDADLDRSVISWGAKNIVNGLIYGNGGIKCWPTQLVLDMKTHENAEAGNSKTQVDFCWDINYIQMDSCMSDVYNNATPYQAWRAGFREGVKMGLLEGSKASPKEFSNQVHWKNFHRLLIWMNVGSDISNGLWAIYGSRLGCYMTNCTDWDYLNVRDFNWLKSFWLDIEPKVNETTLLNEISDLGKKISSELGITIGDPLDQNQSNFFKTVYMNPPRMANNLIIKKNV
jgi:hypothetical protein